MTPLGSPVEPDEYCNMATSSSVGSEAASGILDVDDHDAFDPFTTNTRASALAPAAPTQLSGAINLAMVAVVRMASASQSLHTNATRATSRRTSASVRVHKQIGQSTLAKLKALIAPHFLRRTKAEVFQSGGGGGDESVAAPEQPSVADAALEAYRLAVRKNDFIVWVSLSEVQLEIYQRFLYMPEVKEILNSTKSPLAAITVLKKICQHPRLLRADMKALRESSEPSLMREDSTEEGSADPLEKPVRQLLERIGDDGEDLVGQSGKLYFLVKLVAELLETRHRVLVFSQWQKMLDIIGMVFKQRQWDYMRIDGRMSKTEDRQDLIERFNAGGPGCPNIFLLTTQTGGLGLTLTGADRAIIYDPSWNPLDDQAVDRIYRIGQQRNGEGERRHVSLILDVSTAPRS